MPPFWLIVLAVVGLVALPASAILGIAAVKLAEWYWDRQERAQRPDCQS